MAADRCRTRLPRLVISVGCWQKSEEAEARVEQRRNREDKVLLSLQNVSISHICEEGMSQ